MPFSSESSFFVRPWYCTLCLPPHILLWAKQDMHRNSLRIFFLSPHSLTLFSSRALGATAIRPQTSLPQCTLNSQSPLLLKYHLKHWKLETIQQVGIPGKQHEQDCSIDVPVLTVPTALLYAFAAMMLAFYCSFYFIVHA